MESLRRVAESQASIWPPKTNRSFTVMPANSSGSDFCCNDMASGAGVRRTTVVRDGEPRTPLPARSDRAVPLHHIVRKQQSATPMKHLEELKQLSPPTLRMILCNHVLAVKNKPDSRGLPLWSIVGSLCSVGSTSGHDLCRLANLSPDQKVTPRLTGWDSFAQWSNVV